MNRSTVRTRFRAALKSKLKEALTSVIPVAMIVLILSFTPLLDLTKTETVIFSISSLL